jgi:hypothetical protein
MRMIAPQLDAPQITVAEEQEEFKPITVALVRNGGYGSQRPDGINTVITCWRPTPEERARLAAGEDVYIAQLTFGGPMQGLIVRCGKQDTAETFGVRVAP